MRMAKRRRMAIAVFLLVATVVCAVIFLEHPTLAVAETPGAYAGDTYADEYGRETVAVVVDGKPPDVKALVADVPLSDIAAGVNSLSNVPAFDWSYGCSATSAAMLFGYYDRTGYSNMYSGPTNGGLCPLDNSVWGDTVYPSITCHECPLSATHLGMDGKVTKGHVDDYWIDADDPGPDPYAGNWAEHVLGDCTGDYMGTNQSKFANVDGGTTFWFNINGDPVYDSTSHEPASKDGCHGMKEFALSRGYSVLTNFNQLIQGEGTDPAKGFTFSQYVAEIDAGRPVLIQVEGHTMLGYGYNTTGNIVSLHDTWDHSSHTMTWGGTYLGLQHYGVTVIRLSQVATTTIGTSGLVASYPATVHYVQGGVSKTATTYGTWSEGVDYGSTVSIDNAVAVSSTERYSTNAATSWTANQIATYAVPYYHQFKPAISVFTAGTGHTDLSSTNFATLTRYRFGSAGTFNMFDVQSFNDWVDVGSTVSLPSTSSASTSVRRWCHSGATSWVINDASSYSAMYWEQFRATVVPAGLDTSHPANLHVVRNGLSINAACSTNWSDWADIGSTLSINELVVVSETERYSTTDPTSWTITQTATYSVDYARQYYLTVPSGRGNPQGAGWYDEGSVAQSSVDSVVDETDGIRYVFVCWTGDSSDYSNSSSIVMDRPKTVTASWKEQCQLTVSATPSNATTVSGSGWYDNGQKVNLVAPEVAAPEVGVRHVFLCWSVGGRQVAGRSISVNVNAPILAEAKYRTEYYLDVQSVRGNPRGSGWYNSGSEAAISVESPVGLIVKQVFVKWSGVSSDWVRDLHITVDGPRTVIAEWRTDYTILYVLIGGILLVGIVTGAVIMLVLRRRRHAHLQIE